MKDAEKEGYIKKMERMHEEALRKEEYGLLLKEKRAKEIEMERIHAQNRKLKELELKREVSLYQGKTC